MKTFDGNIHILISVEKFIWGFLIILRKCVWKRKHMVITTYKVHFTDQEWIMYAYVLISMEAVNVLLHSVCIFLLFQIYYQERGSIAQPFSPYLVKSFLNWSLNVVVLILNDDFLVTDVLIFSFAYVCISG